MERGDDKGNPVITMDDDVDQATQVLPAARHLRKPRFYQSTFYQPKPRKHEAPQPNTQAPEPAVNDEGPSVGPSTLWPTADSAPRPAAVQLGRVPRHKRLVALTVLCCVIAIIPVLGAALILSFL